MNEIIEVVLLIMAIIFAIIFYKIYKIIYRCINRKVWDIMKQITIFLILIFSICAAQATYINIYYPQNNTTTDIYYATDGGYNHTINNNISGNISAIILKDHPITDDVITHPEKVYSQFALLIYVLIFGIIIVSIAKVIS